MSIEVQIVDGPLAEETPSKGWNRMPEDAGAKLCFVGVVHADEERPDLRGLKYEVYEPMATFELQRLAYRAKQDHGLYSVKVRHSTGFVPVGKLSFRMQVTAPHHRQAMQAMNDLLDAIKQDVPIWKTPVYATAQIQVSTLPDMPAVPGSTTEDPG